MGDYLQAFNDAQQANAEGYWDVTDEEVYIARLLNVAEIWRKNIETEKLSGRLVGEIEEFAAFAEAKAEKMKGWM